MKPIFLATCLLAMLSSSAESQSKTKEIELGCRTPMFAYADENPFATISSALGRNTGAVKFRVSWSDNLGSGWDKGTMLYDKERSTLKYYDVGGAGEAYYRKSYVFTGLKEDTFVALVKKYNTPKQIARLLPFSFLDTLPRHGCRKYQLSDHKRGF